MIPVLVLAATLGLGPQVVETALELQPEDRVVVENVTGELSVVGWERDRLEVGGENAELLLERSGSRVRVTTAGRPRSVEAILRVPTWAEVEVRSPDLDVSVRGLRGALEVRNVRGDVLVTDAGGRLEIHSVQGNIEIAGAEEGVYVSSQSGDVRLSRVRGTVDAHSGDGDLTLEDVAAQSVRAETLDGDVTFVGSVLEGGRYDFSVHDGDVTLVLPEATSARVSVSTFDGEFEPEVPVVIERFRGGREFEFVLGSGSADVRIEVFDGEIRLRRR